METYQRDTEAKSLTYWNTKESVARTEDSAGAVRYVRSIGAMGDCLDNMEFFGIGSNPKQFREAVNRITAGPHKIEEK